MARAHELHREGSEAMEGRDERFLILRVQRIVERDGVSREQHSAALIP